MTGAVPDHFAGSRLADKNYLGSFAVCAVG